MFAGMQASHAATDALRLPVSRDAAGSVAPDAAVLPAANDAPVKLRVERKFNVLGKKRVPLVEGVGIEHPVDLKKDDRYPMFLVADTIEGRAGEITEAEGDVELRKAGSLLFADKLTYRLLDDEVEATGNVRLLQEGTQV